MRSRNTAASERSWAKLSRRLTIISLDSEIFFALIGPPCPPPQDGPAYEKPHPAWLPGHANPAQASHDNSRPCRGPHPHSTWSKSADPLVLACRTSHTRWSSPSPRVACRRLSQQGKYSLTFTISECFDSLG